MGVSLAFRNAHAHGLKWYFCYPCKEGFSDLVWERKTGGQMTPLKGKGSKDESSEGGWASSLSLSPPMNVCF